MSMLVSSNNDLLNCGNIARDSMATETSHYPLYSFCAPSIPPALYDACFPGTSLSMTATSSVLH